MSKSLKKYFNQVKALSSTFKKYREEYPDLSNNKLAKILAPKLKKHPSYINTLLGAYDAYLKSEGVLYDAEQDEKFEERSVGEIARDEEGNITHYWYEILIRDKAPLKGIFTREEMNTVYRLYSSNDGANLNQRSVSREFPNITFRDFKRILRAFNITKDSIPVAPHILEENDATKTASIIRQNKENVVLKKLEEDRSKYFEKLWRKTLQSLIELKENREYGQEYLQDLINLEGNEILPIRIEVKDLSSGRIAINIYLADIHMGAHTLEDSLYKNPWNEEEAQKCVQMLISELMTVHKYYGRLTEVNLVHLGDGADGMNGKTTGGLKGTSHHNLPQNMGNKEQIRSWIRLMKLTIDAVHDADVANKINFYTTTDDNHSGDFLYGAYLALEEFCKWKYPDMTYKMFEKFIGYFQCGIHTFVCTHGKDKEHMKSGMPLCLDAKTETKINEYLDVKKLFHPNIHFIKADLHQSARQSVARFNYKNVYSTYGASAWIHTNFGVGQAGIDYDIVFMDEERVLEGRIKFKRGSIWDQ